MKRQKTRRRPSLRAQKLLLIIAGALVILFIIANGVLWAVYRERTYPRTKVMGSSIGSINYKALPGKLSDKKLLPTSVKLTYGDQVAEVSFADFGIYPDAERAAKSANSQRSWLPILNLLRAPELKAPIRVDEAQFSAKTAELARRLRKDAANARLVLSGTNVDIQQGVDGFELAQSKLQQAVMAALDMGKQTVQIPTDQTAPKVSADSLKDGQKTLQSQLKTTVTYRYNGKTKQASASDISKWFVQSGETYSLALTPIQAYVAQVGKDFGIRIKDSASVANSTQQAVATQKALDLTLAVQTAAKNFTYCVSAKGVDGSYLPALQSKLQATYADARGWSLDGLVDFKEVGSGCNFTVWLTASSLMPTFGSICDSMWSCRVGPNVVINFDRWQNASPSWNASGGALEDYRYMVINHETGHWLGFNHEMCGGPGQLAPVMQQQSIDLQGCKFNPWPIKSELDSLRRTLGL